MPRKKALDIGTNLLKKCMKPLLYLYQAHRNCLLKLSSERLFILLKKAFCCSLLLICLFKYEWFGCNDVMKVWRKSALNQLINVCGVCRTAPATRGLLKTIDYLKHLDFPIFCCCYKSTMKT